MGVLAKLGRSFQFYTLAGVENVHLEGERVVGRWKSSLVRIYARENGALIHDFLNWRIEPKSIVLFTKTHGPLDREAMPGCEFSFQSSAWTKLQAAMRSIWRNQRKATGDWEMSSDDGDLACENRQLVYRARTLFLFFCMDLVTRPVDQMKMCGCPECPTPFFIARHLRQRFCSEKCAGWGQRQLKKEWWAQYGESWRRERAKTKARKVRRL
jgi:hypothetical protein